MAYLYCPVHGKAHENPPIEIQEDYRHAGETILIVSGLLTTGPHRCDKCNSGLARGDAATLLAAFPRHVVEAMSCYDFSYERRYFDMTKAKVAAYGAPLPGIRPS